MNIVGTVLGSEQVASGLTALGVNIRAAMKEGITRASLRVQVAAKLKLTDDVLHVRTGRLRRSVTFVLEDRDDQPVGIIGTNLDYGRYWEFGFERKVGAGARGGPRAMLAKLKEGTASKSYQTYVSKHPPGVKKYPARSFLRTALDDVRPEIAGEINRALGRAIAGGL